MEPPPMTKHIARTLERYPDGGQILKVCYFLWMCFCHFNFAMGSLFAEQICKLFLNC